MANKKTDRIAEPTRAFIAVSPIVFVSTADRKGRCTVSPRGGEPGFVAVLDERRLAIPDATGNNLIDSFRNIVENPSIGLLFVIPGRNTTLRLEGAAWLTTDDEVLDRVTGADGKRPKVAVGVEVASTFLHCSRSFQRGHIWDPSSWPALTGPSDRDLLKSHLADNLPAEEMPAIPSTTSGALLDETEAGRAD